MTGNLIIKINNLIPKIIFEEDLLHLFGQAGGDESIHS